VLESNNTKYIQTKLRREVKIYIITALIHKLTCTASGLPTSEETRINSFFTADSTASRDIDAFAVCSLKS